MNANVSPRKDKGFTLVELLVVIVVLGVLATITVFAVRGIANRGETSACGQDKKVIETAEESNMAQKGAYATQADLVTNGLMHTQSANYNLSLDASGGYTLTGLGTCAGGGASSGSQVVTGTYAGRPSRSIGAGSTVVLIVGFGAGNTQASQAFDLVAADGVQSGYKVVNIDSSTPPTMAALTAAPLPNYVLWDFNGDLFPNIFSSNIMSSFVPATYYMWMDPNIDLQLLKDIGVAN